MRDLGMQAPPTDFDAREQSRWAVPTLPAPPFGDREFDVVLANFVITHIGQPRAASSGR